VSAKFFWKGQQFARVPGSSRPVNKIPILLEFGNLPKPLRSVLVRNSHHVGKVTRPQATADRQLNALQQPPGAPFFLEPLDGNGGSTVFRVSAATSLANRQMSDDEPFRRQRMGRISRHTLSPSAGRPRAIGKLVRAPSFLPKIQAEAAGRSSG
jgi:hypothetical protein